MRARGGTKRLEGKVIVKAGYNKIARAYLATRDAAHDDVRLLDDLIARLPQGAVVLDAGCGGGLPVTRILAEHFDVTGVDFAEEQIRLARDNVPNAKFVCEDMTALTFADATFDAIVSHYAIIHVPRDEHAGLFANFQRMLKPGGFALLGLGGDDLDDDIEEDYFGARMYWSHFDANTSADMVRQAGFEIVWSRLIADTPSGYHLYVLGRKASG